jgi:hypothetical protein
MNQINLKERRDLLAAEEEAGARALEVSRTINAQQFTATLLPENTMASAWRRIYSRNILQ